VFPLILPVSRAQHRDSQVDVGVNMGLGFLAPQLAANYYNKSLQWNRGQMDAVLNLKAVGGRYNSFQNSRELLPFVDRALVKSTEQIIESEIMAYSFQTETTIADWHYRTGQQYMNAARVVLALMRFGLGASWLGELACHPADLHDRHLRCIGQHNRHGKQRSEFALDVPSRDIGEGLGAVTPLQHESLTGRHTGHLGA
jgi:hypothetical protein